MNKIYKIKLSPYHKIFYNEWQLDPLSSKYNIVFDQTIHSTLDIFRLKNALERLIADYFILNSHIVIIDGEPHWITNSTIRHLDIFNGVATYEQIYAYVSQQFNMIEGPLYRFAIFNQADGNYRFVLVWHHILSDGCAFDELVSEISLYYNDSSYKCKSDLSQQIEFILSLTDKFDKQLKLSAPENKQFWKNSLSDLEPLDLRFIKASSLSLPKPIESNIKELTFCFEADVISKITQLKDKYGLSVYSYGQIIFAILLHKYTSQNKLGLCYPVEIREFSGLSLGSGINTNIFPFTIDKNTKVWDLITHSKNFVNNVRDNTFNHRYLPISEIIAEFDKGLLDVFFIKTNLRDTRFDFNNANVIKINNDFNIDLPAKLLFEQEIKNQLLNYRVRYSIAEVDEAILKQFIKHYQKLFIDVLLDLEQNNSGKCISEYQILTIEEYNKIVYEWNETDKSYLENKTITQLFEGQVIKTPNNIAIVYEDIQLTYQELNQRVNQLAHYLLNTLELKPNSLIALYLDRSEYMLIAILAVLKTGSAYVPLDINHPEARINYILKDAKPQAILTKEYYKSKLNNIGQYKIIFIDSDNLQRSLYKESAINPQIEILDSNLVYILYTSGTTGNPKGVIINNVSCTNRILNMVSASNMQGNERVLFKTNYTFDVSFSDIFVTLITGATLFITKNIFDIDEIETIITNHRINICHFTPSQFEVIKSIKGVSLFNEFKVINFSGEALNPNLVDELNLNICCLNYYGPTESGEVTVDNVQISRLEKKGVTIGYPFSNTKLFILDNNLNPLPIGAVGELYIGGVGIAVGYLNKDELTQERFIKNPFQTHKEALHKKYSKLYKTGDLVRRLDNGNIEYIGRKDLQVKLRGYRIELSEIENQLLKFDGVRYAVALVEDIFYDNKPSQIENKCLIAYYVADVKLNESEINDHLAANLPEYMLPSMIMYLDRLPLTNNGKLDKKLLPKVKLSDTSDHVTPNNNLQNILLDVWAKILQLPKEYIGINDSFFKLGGNSILIIRLKDQISKLDQFRDVTITDLFRYTTIDKLSKFVSDKDSNANIKTIKHKNQFDSEIAIIAISGAFSGCENIDQYWDLINEGREGLKISSVEECRQYGIPQDILQNPGFIPISGHISDTDKFDATFWGITPNEAKYMDPQIRKFLEHCWYVLEVSGYSCGRQDLNIGVFAGGGDSVYVTNFIRQPLIVSGIGNLHIKDALATRASYLLGLNGVANNINTACSTGLVTVIEACKNLASGYCDMALAGGTALLLPEEAGYIYQEGMIFSKDGHCRTFDKDASGTVHGSGVGVVLLKRLSDAQKDNDNILAVIKGYATNNDGNRKISYTAPSIEGQKECIINAQQMAEITSDMIDYIECHGTGTKLGDPIEIKALDEAFKYNANTTSKSFNNECIIGAVKANIGHSGAVAGVAGLIKVCKMLEYKTIPRQINFDIPNPELNIDKTNFVIIKESKEWISNNCKPRLAGISSFGIGGTNAHVVIREYVSDNYVKEIGLTNHSLTHDQINYILPFSAKSASSLAGYKRKFINYLETTKNGLENIAYTLQQKREHFNYRTSIVCSSISDAITKLNSIKDECEIISQNPHNIILMFSGQGNQYSNMSYNLYKNDIDYRNIVNKCIRLINHYTNVKFEKILFPALFNNENFDYDINETQWAQPALFVIGYSLAKLFEVLNIRVVAYAGHSIGELVAATLSGVFAFEDAIKLVIARGRLMQSMPSSSMLSIRAVISDIEQLINDNNCEISVINSPQHIVVSGINEDIKKLKNSLDKISVPSSILKVSHAYHSKFMESASKQFVKEFNDVKLNKPKRMFISNSTGDFITDKDAVSPEYWSKQIRQPVLFAKGVEKLLEFYENPLFIETGPGRSLASFIRQVDVAKRSSTVQILNSQTEKDSGSSDTDCKENILSKLWMCGYNINNHINKQSGRIVRLPSYHFDNKSYWVGRFEFDDMQAASFKSLNMAPVNKELDIKEKIIEADLDKQEYEIARIFLEVLGIEKLSINDDFFELGGDSLLAVSLVTRLQRNYKINVSDIFMLRTVTKIAKFITLAENNLFKKLEQIKLKYTKKVSYSEQENLKMFLKQSQYNEEVEHIVVKQQKKKFCNVLLTGVTGHIGCNILYQLLQETQYKVYLLIRAKSNDEAFHRVSDKFNYYFNNNLAYYKDRIVAIASDIEKQDLAVDMVTYAELVLQIDSIIHSAALVKHYGEYDRLYQANVQATINLLELAKLTRGKDFHYISTLAVVVDGYIPGHDYYLISENDDASIIQNRKGVYAKTKYEGELEVIKYRKYGVKGNIYRPNNVAMHSQTYTHQENIGDNAFFNCFKTMLKFGMMPDELSIVEISPVDSVAMAIIKLFDQDCIDNQTYHIFNPHLVNLYELFAREKEFNVKKCTINEFIDNIIVRLSTNKDTKQIELFMLHQLWLQELDNEHTTYVEVLQNKTNAILIQLGFGWPIVDREMLSKMVNLSFIEGEDK